MIELIILITCSLASILISVNIIFNINKIKRNGIETNGIVFDIEQSVMMDNNASYPLIRFLTVQNVWITKSSRIGVIPGIYKKGQNVIVVYQNDHPEKFFIKSRLTYLVPLIMIIIAIIIAIVGILKLSHI